MNALTQRERDIVKAVAMEALSNRELAGRFGISERTAKWHLRNIFDKTGTSTRLELAAMAWQQGMVK